MTATRRWEGLLFVAPFLLLYSIILIFPLLRGMWLSLHRVELFGPGHFIGLANYSRLLGDPIFQQSLINTFLVTLMIVPPLTVIALALALALNRPRQPFPLPASADSLPIRQGSAVRRWPGWHRSGRPSPSQSPAPPGRRAS